MGVENNTKVNQYGNLNESVSNSETIDYIKQETLKHLNTANKILEKVKDEPELYEKFKKDYSQLQNRIFDSLKTDNELTTDELQIIKADVEIMQGKKTSLHESVIFKLKEQEYIKKINNLQKNLESTKKFDEKDIPFFLENIDQLKLVDDKEFLLKIIDFENKNNKTHVSYVSLEYINPMFRDDFSLIKKLPSKLSYRDLTLMDEKFFKNVNDVAEIFIKTKGIDKSKLFFILKNIHGKEKIIDFLVQLFKTEKIRNNVYGGDISSEIELIPKGIINLDKERKLKIFIEDKDEQESLYETYEQDNAKKIKIKINELFSGKSNKESLIDDIEFYIWNFGIDDIKDGVKNIIKNKYLKKFESLSFYLGTNKDLAILAMEKNSENISHIPVNMRGDNDIISSFFNSKKFNEDYAFMIELNNIDSVIAFYKGIKNKYGTLLNDKFRSSLNNILNSDEFKNRKKTTKEEQIIINEISSKSVEIKLIEEQVKVIKDRTNKNERYYEKMEKTLVKAFGKNNEGIAKDIIKSMKLNGDLTTEIGKKILEGCGNDLKKARILIESLQKIKQKKITKIINRTFKLLKDDLKYNPKLKEIQDEVKLKNNFNIFISENKREKNETFDKYKLRLITEYINIYNLDIEKDEIIIGNIDAMLDLIKINKVNENIDIYTDYILGKITKNEYENKVEEKAKKGKNESEKNDELEKKNEVTTDYNYTENDYVETTSGYNIVSPVDGTTINISEEEKEITQDNPEALKNLINFHDFFKDLNLLSIWKYRSDIVDSMKDININLDDDSFKKTELIKFGNNLIKFVNNMGENEKGKKREKLLISNTLGGIRNQLKNYSGANSMLSDDKTHGIYGNDRFEYDLRRLGIIGNSLGFQKETFRKIMINEIK